MMRHPLYNTILYSHYDKTCKHSTFVFLRGDAVLLYYNTLAELNKERLPVYSKIMLERDLTSR